MKLHLTKAVHNVLSEKYESMLENGAFPEVKWEKVRMPDYTSRSYSMFEYLEFWGRFTKLVDGIVKEHFGDAYGVFTRKRSQAFLDELAKVIEPITENDVRFHKERFRTFMDDVLGAM